MEDTMFDHSKEDKKKLVKVDPDVERVRRYTLTIDHVKK